jgi:hypothetical protein
MRILVITTADLESFTVWLTSYWLGSANHYSKRWLLVSQSLKMPKSKSIAYSVGRVREMVYMSVRLLALTMPRGRSSCQSCRST